jgi:integrase
MGHSEFDPAIRERGPWNAGRMVGAKRALKPQQVWAIRFWLDRERRVRDRALFDLAIDSKLRGCDVVKIRISELVSGGRVRTRATVVQQKTGRPVQFELLEAARSSLQAWLECRGGTIEDYAFPSRVDRARHMGTRQYARLVDEWVTAIGLRREDYGTHSLRRTKASIIYKATGNLRAVQLLLRRATYCPRTSGRRADLLSVPSAMRRDRSDQATARVPRRPAGGHRAARQLTRLHSGVDDARVGSSIRAQ